MSDVNDLHRKWMKSDDYRKAYEELADEFALARSVIEAGVEDSIARDEIAPHDA
jgi:hypothetical protein